MTGTPRMSVAQYREMHGLGPVEPAPRISSSPANPRDFLQPAAAHRTAGHQGAAADQVKACRAGRGGVKAKQPQGGQTNKYRARRTVGPGGRVFDSKAEAQMARRLEEERAAGGIVSWIPQPSIPCGVDENGRDIRYRADALVVLAVNPDGSFVGRLLDRKGVDTPASRAKRGALRSLYGLSVEVL